MHRILFVDDDPALLRSYSRVLAAEGWQVEAAADGAIASQKLAAGGFDVIVSDVSMPTMGGLDFLRAVRRIDFDVPVILMTGSPDLDSAIHAIEYGAFRYLLKPVAPELLLRTAHHAARLYGLARLKRQALEMAREERRRQSDRAGLEAHFALGLDQMWMAYQPVVRWPERQVFGYEALLRSDEPSIKSPADMLDCAEQLDRMHDLSRAVRSRVAADAASSPGETRLFVNIHASDLNDDDLYSPIAPLTRIAGRVVLEITERESLDGIGNLVARVDRLRALGFQIAVDDLGAGYAGLSSYSQLAPEIAKIDMSLVRGIDADQRKRTIVHSMKTLCDELKTVVVAEGVETVAERDALQEVGCNLLQGYLFAKPGRGFPEPTW